MEVVIVLMNPIEAVYCMSRGKDIPQEEAAARWLFYFKSILSTSASFERIHLVEYRADRSEHDLRNTFKSIDPFHTLIVVFVLRRRVVFIRLMSFAENVVFLFKYGAIKSKKLFSGLAYILEC